MMFKFVNFVEINEIQIRSILLRVGFLFQLKKQRSQLSNSHLIFDQIQWKSQEFIILKASMASFQTSISVKTKIKVILLGDSAVGKSSIIGAIRDQPFNFQHEATVGIDFFSKNLFGNQYQYKLQFWDTAGQQRFKSIIPSYIRNAQVGVLVYDVGNRNSFQCIDIWFDMFRQYSPQDSTILLMANKIDITHRVVQQEEGQQKAKSLGINYIQLSAKTRQGIHRLDSMLLHLLESAKFDPDIKSERSIRTIEIRKGFQNLDPKIAFRNRNAFQQCCYI